MSKDEVMAAIKEMNVLEVADLVKALEEEFGISAAPVAVAAAPAAGAAVLDESSREPVGTISSAAVSPADGRPVALALLKTRLAPPGSRVIVKPDDSTEIPASVLSE